MAIDRATADELLRTTRAVRKRLDLERPVPDAVLLECLRLAIQAPTGSNAQGWRWIVVTDPEKRAALADLYRRGFAPYIAEQESLAGERGDPVMGRVRDSAVYLAEVLDRVPVHVIPCIWGRGFPIGDNFVAASIYGSVFPAVWSLQLALRARGLGSALTTLHLRHEREAASVLGIPDGVLQVGLLPVAYTIGDEFRPAPRRPVEEVAYWNSWKVSPPV